MPRKATISSGNVKTFPANRIANQWFAVVEDPGTCDWLAGGAVVFKMNQFVAFPGMNHRVGVDHATTLINYGVKLRDLRPDESIVFFDPENDDEDNVEEDEETEDDDDGF